MELLKQLLSADKITVENLEAEVKALGFDPSNLSDDETLVVVEKLKENHGTKTLKPGKKAVKPNLTTELVTEKAAKANASIVATYQNLSEKVVERDAAKIITIIENIPNATMERVRELLGDSEGNLDFFLNSTADLESNFLSKFGVE